MARVPGRRRTPGSLDYARDDDGDYFVQGAFSFFKNACIPC